MTKESNPKARETELVVQELKGELLLYDLNNNKAYCLNETSAAIWNLCDGNNSVSDITNRLSKRLKQPVPDELIYLALDQFKRDDLLLESDEMEIDFKGLSRREVIRKAGLASMVILPVISSLIAPTAAMAQSGLATNLALLAVCSVSTQCTSGNCWEVQSGGKACCVSTARTNVSVIGGNFEAGDRLPGCFDTQADCNSAAAQRCCSGNAQPITNDPGCAGGVPGFAFQCSCA